MRWMNFVVLLLGLALLSGCRSETDKGKNSNKDRPKPAEMLKNK